MVKIACIGDSIMEGHCDFEKAGWVNRLSLALAGNAIVFNLGISNSNTAELFQRFGEVQRRRPDVLIVAASTNDVLKRKGAQPDTFEISVMKRVRAWQKLLDIMTGMSCRILVIGPSPVDESVMPVRENNVDIPEYQGYYAENKNVAEYDLWFEGFFKKYDIPYLSFYQDWAKRDVASLMKDGLHPNSEGHQLIFEMVLNKLQALSYLEVR